MLLPCEFLPQLALPLTFFLANSIRAGTRVLVFSRTSTHSFLIEGFSEECPLPFPQAPSVSKSLLNFNTPLVHHTQTPALVFLFGPFYACDQMEGLKTYLPGQRQVGCSPPHFVVSRPLQSSLGPTRHVETGPDPVGCTGLALRPCCWTWPHLLFLPVLLS